jgi:hypothetical protein
MGKSQIWPEVIGKLFHKPWCFLKTEEGIRNLYNIRRFNALSIMYMLCLAQNAEKLYKPE